MILLSWLQTHLFTCSFREHLGIDCPGCGFQRAFVELAKGNLSSSLHLYPALIPVLSTLGLTTAHLLHPLREGAALVKYLFLLTTGVILLSYLQKIL